MCFSTIVYSNFILFSDHSEDPGLNWRIILRQIFRKWDGGTDRKVLAQS